VILVIFYCYPRLDFIQVFAIVYRRFNKETMNEEQAQNRELASESAALEQEIRGEFLRIVSHQFRTPLTGLKWALELVLTDYAHEVSETVRNLLEEARRKNELMMSLVDRLIVVSQVDSGELSFRWSVGDVGRLVAQTIEQHLEQARAKSITLHYQKSLDPLPVVRLDLEKMSMVLDNLLFNAIKFTPAGGHINIRARRESKEIIVSVRDTGVGVPRDQSPLIFSKFFWARNVALHMHDGLGVGLYICRAIVEAHGGRIEADSEEGQGSEFRVCLPLLSDLSRLG